MERHGAIAIVEDDDQLRETLRRGLAEEGFTPRAVATGGALLETLDDGLPDAFVIDVGLPDSDGRDICQALRARGIRTPVLFLTAHDAVVDRLSGFESGGDDYLAKPFAFAELVARLHALVRRGGSAEAAVVDAAGIRLDPRGHRVVAGTTSVPLTPTEFRLLARLLANPEHVVRRNELVRAGWPRGAIVRANTLDAYVARLRRKLRQLPGAPSIATVHMIGYRIDPAG
jgi:two-component system response regulator MprA